MLRPKTSRHRQLPVRYGEPVERHQGAQQPSGAAIARFEKEVYERLSQPRSLSFFPAMITQAFGVSEPVVRKVLYLVKSRLS